MKTDSGSSIFDTVWAQLESNWEQRGSEAFRSALSKLKGLATSGDPEICESLAEILSLDGPDRDPAAAYRWYYVALSQQGYSVDFQDQNLIPPSYCGPVGDFRNEAQVSALIDELGFDRIRQLDEEAQAWLKSRHLTMRSSGP